MSVVEMTCVMTGVVVEPATVVVTTVVGASNTTCVLVGVGKNWQRQPRETGLTR